PAIVGTCSTASRRLVFRWGRSASGSARTLAKKPDWQERARVGWRPPRPSGRRLGDHRGYHAMDVAISTLRPAGQFGCHATGFVGACLQTALCLCKATGVALTMLLFGLVFN